MRRRTFALAGGFAAAGLCGPARAAAGEVGAADFVARFGATDTAVQAAIDAAVAARLPVVHLPALPRGRAYEVRGMIRNDGVLLRGDGPDTVLRKIGRGSCFVSGRIPGAAAAPLAGDVTAGADRIGLAVCPGLTLRAGAVYVLVSEARCHRNTPAHCGEFVTVVAVSGGAAVIDRPLLYAYRVSEKASIRDASLAVGVGYRDLRIEMDPAVVPPGAMTRFDNYGLQLDFCRAPVVGNVSISNGVAAGIRLLGCMDARIEGYEARNLGSAEEDRDGTSSAGLGGYGYGIAERGLNRGLVVAGAVTDGVRHLYTSAAEWFDTFRYGMPAGSLISNATSRNAKAACFDTHETGLGITFKDCHADGGRVVGFQLRSKAARVVSCTARRLGGAAVWAYGADVHANAAGDGCIVSDLRCEDTNSARPSVHGVAIDWAETGAILDQGFGNQFDSVRIARCGGPAVTVAARARGGVYEDFTVSQACQAARTMRYAVVAEQDAACAVSRIAGMRVTDSPRAMGAAKASGSRCRLPSAGIRIE